jgi:D-sedoheptulose 7-phosphate isomerase
MDWDEAFEAEAKAVRENLRRQEEALAALKPSILKAAEALRRALGSGGKVLLFGNGGSAADAQHWAAELTGHYMRKRKGLAAIALTTDTSALTAIGNDDGYNQVFSRQVEALARPGDCAVGISTSGNSENVRLALAEARARGCSTVAVLGRDGGTIRPEADVALVYDAEKTPRIQEFHVVLGHLLCALVDADTTLG